MYHGDRSRKQTLVEYGFRMPSALDNRPLGFEEFEHRTNQVVYVSATPGPYELTRSAGVIVEQVIRPTGLIDPEVEVRPVKGQVDDLLEEIRQRAEKSERVLVTTLTKRMSEDLAEYFSEVGVRCRYLHSEIETLERVRILRDLRRGEYDVLIGINLLREGLDLPEVSLVAILDADKEGYLRSATALIQTIGRCARHVNGRAILYADVMTGSMVQAIGETNRRRAKQLAYNTEHGITPQSIIKSVDMKLAAMVEADYVTVPADDPMPEKITSEEQLRQVIAQLEIQMREAAKKFEFERAAGLRDRIRALQQRELGGLLTLLALPDPAAAAPAPIRPRWPRQKQRSRPQRRPWVRRSPSSADLRLTLSKLSKPKLREHICKAVELRSSACVAAHGKYKSSRSRKTVVGMRISPLGRLISPTSIPSRGATLSTGKMCPAKRFPRAPALRLWSAQ